MQRNTQQINRSFFFLLVLSALVACNSGNLVDDPRTNDNDTSRLHAQDTMWHRVPMQHTIMQVQPMTGLVLWQDAARDLFNQYGNSIALEFSYCLPCAVVTGKVGDNIQYDWSSFDRMLEDISSRNHQAIVRFRYEYPNNTDVDGKKGTTAVPDYIKKYPDYHETYSKDPGGDGPTYYADWSNTELQWFTKQFYVDFNERYGADPRIAFLEVGFGHWSEYHIYGTPLSLGLNFPTKEYQKEFLLHLSAVMNIPWAVSIDAADDYYSPIPSDPALIGLNFGLFDDSFMHKEHDKAQGEGYNEECWQIIDANNRWHHGVCGGEISYYSVKDQREFLNPNGLYGVTWEAASAKYHISFMIANDAPQGVYGTPERFEQAGLLCGYRLKVLDCLTSAKETRVLVKNIGIAPLYRDAYLSIGLSRCQESLIGLLPGEKGEFVIPQELTSGDLLQIVSDAILPTQKIEYECNISAERAE